MFNSTWDLEVHARDMQERRLREATRARQIDAARAHGVQAHRFSIARLVAVSRAWLSPRRAMRIDPVDAAEAPAHAGTGTPPLLVAEPLLQPVAPPGRLSRPYADMVVLVRGTGTPIVEQPCGVGDC